MCGVKARPEHGYPHETNDRSLLLAARKRVMESIFRNMMHGKLTTQSDEAARLKVPFSVDRVAAE